MPPEYKENQCAPLRAEIYEEASVGFSGMFSLQNLRIHAFSPDVFKSITALWAPEGRRYPHWNWKQFHQSVVNKPCRFEAVVSLADTPLGVIIGKPDKTGQYLGIPYLEAFSGDHPLTGQVAAVLLAVAGTYALKLGLEEVRILDPIEDLIAFYQELGFETDHDAEGELYLFKRTREGT